MNLFLALALACATHRPPASPPPDPLAAERTLAEARPQGEERVLHLATVAEAYAKRGAEQRAAGDEPSAAASYAEALSIWAQIEAENPEAAAIERVWLAHAQGLVAVGRQDEALALATRVIRERPASPDVPDAYMFLGDQYAAINQQFKALSAYMKVASFPDYSRGAEAQLKLAWAYYGVGEYGRALDGMKRLADLPEGSNGMTAALRAQTLQDLTVIFADSGALADAEAFYLTRDQLPLLNDTRLRYARNLLEQGKTDPAYDALDAVMTSAPDSEQAAIAAKMRQGD